MKDLTKIYYLDRNPESKRNIPFDTNFYLLHIKGVGTSVNQEIGYYDHNKWLLKGSLREVHPFGYCELPKWNPEVGAPEEVPEIFEGTMNALNNLTIRK